MSNEDEAAAMMAELVKAGNTRFDDMVAERHAMGAEKYGPVNFMAVDSIEMALEELADLANYTRYTFIKLHLLRASLQSSVELDTPTLGPTSFIPNGG